MEGVTIGGGVIIGAGSIVTKDIHSYAIVAGVSAKSMKYRFENEEIEFLLNIKCWNKDEEWIKKNAEYFQVIKTFMKIYSMK